AVGGEIVARARTDGFTNAFTGTIPTGPGLWISNTTPATIAGGQLPGVTPWFLSSANQFRPAPPPAFGSTAFTAALAEIRQISDTRTADQVQSATFWAQNAGTPTTAAYWIHIATDGINEHALKVALCTWSAVRVSEIWRISASAAVNAVDPNAGGGAGRNWFAELRNQGVTPGSCPPAIVAGVVLLIHSPEPVGMVPVKALVKPSVRALATISPP